MAGLTHGGGAAAGLVAAGDRRCSGGQPGFQVDQGEVHIDGAIVEDVTGPGAFAAEFGARAGFDGHAGHRGVEDAVLIQRHARRVAVSGTAAFEGVIPRRQLSAVVLKCCVPWW